MSPPVAAQGAQATPSTLSNLGQISGPRRPRRPRPRAQPPGPHPDSSLFFRLVKQPTVDAVPTLWRLSDRIFRSMLAPSPAVARAASVGPGRGPPGGQVVGSAHCLATVPGMLVCNSPPACVQTENQQTPTPSPVSGRRKFRRAAGRPGGRCLSCALGTPAEPSSSSRVEPGRHPAGAFSAEPARGWHGTESS